MVYGCLEHTWLRHEVRSKKLDAPALTSKALTLLEPALLAPIWANDHLLVKIECLRGPVEASLNDLEPSAQTS